MSKNTFTPVFGALKSKVDIREYYVSSIAKNDVEIPSEFELAMPEVKNQENIGSCVAHALSTAVEYYNSLQEGNNKMFSTGYIYGNRRNSNYYGSGMEVDKAINNVVKWGDVYLSLFSYNIEVPDAIAKFEEKAFDLAPDAYPHRFSSFFRLDTDEQRKLSLMQNGPIIFSIPWYADYYVEKKTHLLKHSTDVIAGYHCMIMYGWDENGWKFQNSWGTAWGYRGRAVLPYGAKFDTCYGIKDEITSICNDEKINQLKAQILELTRLIEEKEKEIKSSTEDNALLEKQLKELLEQVKSLMDELEQAQELNKELLEIHKPYENIPKWLAQFINFIINLFHKENE